MASDNEGRAEAIRKPTFGYIYFIESGPYYKIGKTVHPETRPMQIISSIQRHEPKLPFEPRLVAVLSTWVDRMSSLEEAMHYMFSSYAGRRLQGEWFQVERENILLLMRKIEENQWPVWIDRIIWDGYAEKMEMPVVVPCPS